ncbi:hypothetical protein ABZP36_035170 [Zizania latifolia]
MQENRSASSVHWIGKVNFVEICSFWHIFRSFDIMWIFLILSLQVGCSRAFIHFLGYFPFLFANIFLMSYILIHAMIIIVWNGGAPSDIFDVGVLKQVLSIFITAAVLKLGQGI